MWSLHGSVNGVVYCHPLSALSEWSDGIVKLFGDGIGFQTGALKNTLTCRDLSCVCVTTRGELNLLHCLSAMIVHSVGHRSNLIHAPLSSSADSHFLKNPLTFVVDTKRIPS